MMEPLMTKGPSARDWLKQESEAFRESFEEIMCRDNIEDVEKFMAMSDEHPRFVWLNLLLSSPSKAKSGNDSVETELASRMWIQLLKYFPDVLHRELFLDGFHWISLKEEMVERFGALHGAVLCGRPEIVQLLSDHRKNAKLVGNAICRPLREYLDQCCERRRVSLDCFDSIKRAILWSHLPNPSEYKKVVAFLKAFEKAKDSDNERDLESVIQTERGIESEAQTSSEPIGATENNWEFLVWTIIIAWASACGRGDIIDKFKNLRHSLFQTCFNSPLWKALFSESVEVTYIHKTDRVGDRKVNLEVIYRRTVYPTYLVVEKIVKIVNQVMTVVEGSNDSDAAFIDIVSVYNISCRVPTSHLRPSICNGRWTAFHLAAAVGAHAVLAALVKSHDLVRRTFPDNKITFQGRDHKTITLHLQDSLCDTLLMTPLHHAVLGNHLLVVETLLQWDFFVSHVNAVDIYKRTAFQIACSGNNRVSILEELVSSGGIDTNTKDCCGFTPLHWAVYVGEIDVVRVLVSEAKGMIRPMVKCDNGQHPYRVAEDLDLPKKKDIQALLESIQEVKDDVERMYRDRQVYVDAANAILVGAALIASVTFGGWLQLPLGDGHESTYTKVRVYWVFNSLSFFLAIGTVMAGAETVLPQADVYIEDAVESIRKWLVNTAFMFVCSIVFVLGAFTSAGFASSSLVSHLNLNMVSTTIIGTSTCSMLGMSFCLRLFRIGKIQWSKRLHSTLNGLKQGACLSDISTHIRKRIQDLCFPSLKESHGGRDEASLQDVWKSCKDVIAYEHGNKKLQENLTQILHPHLGHQVCRIRRCYKGLEDDSKVSEEWLNENFLPDYTVMWKRILETFKVLGGTAAKPRKPASFFFQDETGKFTLASGTEILERYGIVRVEKGKELLRRLETLNRRGHDNLFQEYMRTNKIELKVPDCCEGCQERIQQSLIEMDGVDSVRLDPDAEKVTITGKVTPEGALKEAKKVVRRSEMWPKKDEGKKDDKKKNLEVIREIEDDGTLSRVKIFYEGYDPAWVFRRNKGPPVETKPKPPAPKPDDKRGPHPPPTELQMSIFAVKNASPG